MSAGRQGTGQAPAARSPGHHARGLDVPHAATRSHSDLRPAVSHPLVTTLQPVPRSADKTPRFSQCMFFKLKRDSAPPPPRLCDLMYKTEMILGWRTSGRSAGPPAFS